MTACTCTYGQFAPGVVEPPTTHPACPEPGPRLALTMDIEMLICGECGHGHQPPATNCPDHNWTDACPCIGLDCPPKTERDRVAAELDAAYLDRGEWYWP